MEANFTGMPRMQKLFDEVIGNGKCTESPVSASAKDYEHKRRPIQPVGDGKADRNTTEHAE